MRPADERGQVTAFVVVFTLALLFMAGLVIDGGYLLAAKRRAINEAEAAARAGAQALSVDSYRASGTQVLDAGGSRAAAQEYLARVGHQGDVEVTGDRVVVNVRLTQPMFILGIGGLGKVEVSGRGEARTVRGVVQAET